jgi:hypothetical protein
MNKFLALLFCALFTSSVFATNTSGYEKIREVKAWANVIDVYMQSNQEHQCSGGSKTRFLADASKPQYVSFLLAAFSAGHPVSLSYYCNSGGYPMITGVRVRQS